MLKHCIIYFGLFFAFLFNGQAEAAYQLVAIAKINAPLSFNLGDPIFKSSQNDVESVDVKIFFPSLISYDPLGTFNIAAPNQNVYFLATLKGIGTGGILFPFSSFTPNDIIPVTAQLKTYTTKSPPSFPNPIAITPIATGSINIQSIYYSIYIDIPD